MSKYIITCCSTADMSKDFFTQNNIPYVCFHYKIGENSYPDDLGETIPFDKFYKMIEDGATPTTSLVNTDEFIQFWKKYLDEGYDIIHLTLSSGISGTYNSAVNAADIIAEDYPDRKVTVIDSLGASSGFGLLVTSANENLKNNMSYEDNVKWIEDNKLNVQSWFFSTDLTSYVRGGRISKASAVFGTALHICPLINVSYEGKLIVRAKCRGKKRAITQIVDEMEARATNGTDYDGLCYISNSACYDDAKAVADEIESRFPKLKGKILINSIGTVIGSHTGPGTVALFYYGEKRCD